MITNTVASNNDMDLVAESLSGNRDAFGQIVSRYQNLICSLAYSATGNLTQSEDLAQETFFTAWKQLGDLREPAKLRAWLCGIARNLINSALRRQGREPVHHAETLEAADESPALERLPAEQTISNEEQAILWRSLERIPALYREPLVLYYREHQSIEAVAESLELSEDTVKQRLSRGRKLLQEEVAAFVEGALRQSAPGQAFAGTVLSALPLKTATLATAGAGAAKSGGFLSLLTLPVVSFFGSLFGSIWVVRNAENPLQKKMLKQGMTVTWVAVALIFILQILAGILRQRLHWNTHQYALMEAANFWFFLLLLLTTQVVFFHHHQLARLRAENAGADSNGPGTKKHLFSGFRGLLAWVGMMVGGLGWLVNVALDAGDSLAVGITVAVCALTIIWPVTLNAILGAQRAKVSWLWFAPPILMYGVILLMLNWRLDLWIAVGHGTENSLSLEEAHQILPMWIPHVGTVALLVWVGILLMIRRAKVRV